MKRGKLTFDQELLKQPKSLIKHNTLRIDEKGQIILGKRYNFSGKARENIIHELLNSGISAQEATKLGNLKRLPIEDALKFVQKYGQNFKITPAQELQLFEYEYNEREVQLKAFLQANEKRYGDLNYGNMPFWFREVLMDIWFQGQLHTRTQDIICPQLAKCIRQNNPYFFEKLLYEFKQWEKMGIPLETSKKRCMFIRDGIAIEKTLSSHVFGLPRETVEDLFLSNPEAFCIEGIHYDPIMDDISLVLQKNLNMGHSSQHDAIKNAISLNDLVLCLRILYDPNIQNKCIGISHIIDQEELNLGSNNLKKAVYPDILEGRNIVGSMGLYQDLSESIDILFNIIKGNYEFCDHQLHSARNDGSGTIQLPREFQYLGLGSKKFEKRNINGNVMPKSHQTTKSVGSIKIKNSNTLQNLNTPKRESYKNYYGENNFNGSLSSERYSYQKARKPAQNLEFVPLETDRAKSNTTHTIKLKAADKYISIQNDIATQSNKNQNTKSTLYNFQTAVSERESYSNDYNLNNNNNNNQELGGVNKRKSIFTKSQNPFIQENSNQRQSILNIIQKHQNTDNNNTKNALNSENASKIKLKMQKATSNNQSEQNDQTKNSKPKLNMEAMMNQNLKPSNQGGGDETSTRKSKWAFLQKNIQSFTTSTPENEQSDIGVKNPKQQGQNLISTSNGAKNKDSQEKGQSFSNHLSLLAKVKNKLLQNQTENSPKVQQLADGSSPKITSNNTPKAKFLHLKQAHAPSTPKQRSKEVEGSLQDQLKRFQAKSTQNDKNKGLLGRLQLEGGGAGGGVNNTSPEINNNTRETPFFGGIQSKTTRNEYQNEEFDIRPRKSLSPKKSHRKLINFRNYQSTQQYSNPELEEEFSKEPPNYDNVNSKIQQQSKSYLDNSKLYPSKSQLTLMRQTSNSYHRLTTEGNDFEMIHEVQRLALIITRFWLVPKDIQVVETQSADIGKIFLIKGADFKISPRVSRQISVDYGYDEKISDSSHWASQFSEHLSQFIDRLAKYYPCFSRLKQVAKAWTFALWILKNKIPLDSKTLYSLSQRQQMRHLHKGSMDQINFWNDKKQSYDSAYKIKLTNYTVRPITSFSQAEKSSLKGGDKVPVLKISEVFNPRQSSSHFTAPTTTASLQNLSQTARRNHYDPDLDEFDVTLVGVMFGMQEETISNQITYADEGSGGELNLARKFYFERQFVDNIKGKNQEMESMIQQNYKVGFPLIPAVSCEKCTQVLRFSELFCSVEGKYYCRLHHPLSCGYCFKIVPKGFVKVGKFVYHKQCLVCRHCGQNTEAHKVQQVQDFVVHIACKAQYFSERQRELGQYGDEKIEH